MTKQKVHDIKAAGKLQKLRSLWDSIASHGPNIGFHPKASKSWFIAKNIISMM